MSASFRILHLADTHIGADLPRRPRLPGPRRGDDFIASYRRVLDRARAENVDLVIHAGDLYDTPAPTNAAIMAAVIPLRELAADGIPVLIVPGNHERCLLPESPFLSHQNIHIVNEPETRVFNGRSGVRVAVSSFPCIRRGVRDRFDEALAATRWREFDADCRILVSHQSFDSAVCGPANYRFPKKDADVVARERVPSEFGYVAAGHVHRHQKLRPAERLTPQIVYAGSTDRITFAEMDEPKGCVLLEVDAGSVAYRFIEHDIRPMSVWPVAVTGLDRRSLLDVLEPIIAGLPENAIAQVRVGGVTDRTAFNGLRIREHVERMRPDVLVNISFRGIDFVRRGADAAGNGGTEPRASGAGGSSDARSVMSKSAFGVLQGEVGRVHRVSTGNTAALPRARGVYAMYDASERLLYVGKAADLRSRTRAHLSENGGTNFFYGWTSQIARIEAILAETDEDAIRIESRLIREHKPPFNWFGT